MVYGNDNCIVLASRFLRHINTVFLHNLVVVGVCINNIAVYAEIFQLVDNVDYARISDVGDILLEGHTHNENPRLGDFLACIYNHLYNLVGYACTHTVVESTTRINHTCVITKLFCLVKQVVRVNTDAMSANKTRRELQEVPLCSCCFQNLVSVDSHDVEYD